ncbi:MAG: alpha/beta fold hydrolase [Acidobacteriota bacterium]
MSSETQADPPPARRRWGRFLLVAYVVALALSHLVRVVGGRFGDDPPTALPAAQLDEVRIAAGGGDGGPALERTGRAVRLTYREWLPPSTPSSTLLLVHGSPGSSDNFDRLAPLLAERGLRVIAPDLPGFGDSTARIADYSILAHAEYCRQLLAELGIERAHALGFSLGGGVVLHLAAADAGPEIESLVLLASIGVQELELLGHYAINHAIHGAQLALFRGVQELVPHFGVLDRSHVHLSYARNFYDTDQRPLRGLLEQWRGPMLILHGEGDVLVPYAAALEHRRIVPQSELVTYDANHFMPFTRPGALVDPIVDFVEGARAGAAPTRADASPERLRLAAEGEPQRLPRATGPTLVVWILLLMVATLVSEDLTCLAAGLLVAYGSLGFGPAVFACAAGIFVGDLGLYAIGRLGRPFIGTAPLRWFIKPADLERSRLWFEERGALVILLSRFVPGTRLPTYVGAGLLSMNPLTFSLYLLIPVALWTPLLVSLARVAGEPILGFFETFEEWALPAMVGTLFALWTALILGRKLSSWEGRRRLVGAWGPGGPRVLWARGGV